MQNSSPVDQSSVHEKVHNAAPGGIVLIVLLGALGACAVAFSQGVLREPSAVGAVFGVLATVAVVACFGFFVVNPNEAKLLQLFGTYVGTVKRPGLAWANPFYTKRAVSLRAMSHELERIKVNDLDGNPIEIGAIIVWRVVDSAQACFQVDRYDRYVAMQAEAALRNLATSYPYDAHEEGHESLRGTTAKIAEHLRGEVQQRLGLAGVEVIEARISHLAYAPEIAQAMLQRQQASAIIAARQKIVEGAVGMVEMALDRLAKNKVVELDEERKAQMVSNLLVVLCSERSTQPIVNAGTLYS